MKINKIRLGIMVNLLLIYSTLFAGDLHNSVLQLKNDYNSIQVECPPAEVTYNSAITYLNKSKSTNLTTQQKDYYLNLASSDLQAAISLKNQCLSDISQIYELKNDYSTLSNTYNNLSPKNEASLNYYDNAKQTYTYAQNAFSNTNYLIAKNNFQKANDALNTAINVAKSYIALINDVYNLKSKVENKINVYKSIRIEFYKATVIFNQALARYQEAKSLVSQQNYLLAKTRFTKALEHLNEAIQLIGAYKTAITNEIKSKIEKAGDRIQQAQELLAKARSLLARELLNSALDERSKTKHLVENGKLQKARLHLFRTLFLIEKSIEVSKKNLTHIVFIRNELKRLHEKLDRIKAKINDAENESAERLFNETRKLYSEIAHLLKSDKVEDLRRAVKLITRTHFLADKVVSQLQRSVEHDKLENEDISHHVKRYNTLVAQVKKQLKNKIAENIKKDINNLLKSSNNYFNKANKTHKEGNRDLSLQLYRKAIKLVLRAQDVSSTQPHKLKNKVKQEISAVRKLVANAKEVISTTDNPIAKNLSNKAQEFFTKSVANFKENKYKLALDQLTISRNLITRSIKIVKSGVDRDDIKTKINNELAETGHLIRKALSISGDASNEEAIKLAKLAEEFHHKAQSLYKRENYQPTMQILISASKFAHKAVQLARGQRQQPVDSVQDAVDRERKIIQNFLAEINRKSSKFKNDNVRLLIHDAEGLLKRAEKFVTNKQYQAALLVYKSLKQLLIRSAKILSDLERIVNDFTDKREAVVALHAKAKTLLDKNPNSNVSHLITLSQQFLKRAVSLMHEKHPLAARESLQTANNLALRALELVHAKSSKVDKKQLIDKAKTLDNKLEKAQQLLQK